MLLKPSDFIGFYKISTDCYTENDLIAAIEQWEDYFLCQLFGDIEKQKYIEQLTGYVVGPPEVTGSFPSTTPDFLAIEIPFCKSSLGCKYNASQGIKNMLLGFIYYKYSPSAHFKSTTGGTIIPMSGNANSVSPRNLGRIAEQKHNHSVATLRAIQLCICENIAAFPDYDGCDIEPIFMGTI